VRTLAIASTSADIALAAAVSLLSLSEQDSNALSIAAMVAVPLVAAAAYLRAAFLQAGRTWLIPAWIAMLAGSIVLISFSFIVWPLLLVALPYAITARASKRNPWPECERG
jgi:hypothetical protein